jgi:hypothetical protein
MVRNSGLKQGASEFLFQIYITLEKKNVETLKARELNFDKFRSGELHERHAVATWNLGTISAFA